MQISVGLSNVLGRIHEIESRLSKLGLTDEKRIPVGFNDILKDATEEVAPEPIAPDNSAILDLIGSAANTNHLDPNLAKAVATVESGLNPSAVSGAGAMGLMQLMPKTAADLGVSNLLDPAQNALGGTKYLKTLLDKYHQSLPNALAAYNAGPTAVDKAHGVPPFAETKQYIEKVLAQYHAYQQEGK